MSEWIDIKDHLPEEPKCLEDCKEYIVTVDWSCIGDDNTATTLMYVGDGEWEDLDGDSGYDVIAWQELPEAYEKKYRWRFNPDGYGNLRRLYLTAAFPVLTLAEWDIPVEKDNYKNVFTNQEFYNLSQYWGFDTDLFVFEEIEEPVG